MNTIFFIIVVFVIIFIYLARNNKEGYENNAEPKENNKEPGKNNTEPEKNNTEEINKHDFLEIIKDWGRIYNQYTYKNKPLAELDNKYNSYLMCKELRIPTPELYYYGNFNDINKNIFNKNAFVIKPIQECNSNNVFTLIKKNNKFINIFNGKDVEKKELNNVFKDQKVIVEEFIKNDDGEYTIPDDYKIFCFKGEIEFILHRTVKENKLYSNCYDKDWNPLDIKVNNLPKGELRPRPRKYLQMLEYCRIMAGKVFPDVFVRLDFYFNNTDPVFGEVTPGPNGGQELKDKKTHNFLNYLCKKNDLSL